PDAGAAAAGPHQFSARPLRTAVRHRAGGAPMIRLLCLAVVVFLALPNVIIIASSFSATTAFGFPADGLSLRWYANLFSRSTFGSGLVLSLLLAALATILATIVGTAAAFAIVRYRFPGRNLINTLVMGPLIVPEVVLGLSFLITFN